MVRETINPAQPGEKKDPPKKNSNKLMGIFSLPSPFTMDGAPH